MRIAQREFLETVEARGEDEASCAHCGFTSTIDDLYDDPGAWHVIDDEKIECDACREADREPFDIDDVLDYDPYMGSSGPDYWQNDDGEWRCG